VEIIRDPLWNNVRVDATTLRLVDTPVFQRLRYVRQLGLAYLVYPGATHTRFEHALGTYHLARTTLALLAERGALGGGRPDECAVVRAAALLHDVGHYPFSHALEEIGVPHHERVARPLLTGGAVAEVLRAQVAPDAPERVYALVCGAGDSPLRGLISGSLDLDKIEYLKRDALMCGVPYGEIDVDRLLNALVVVDDPATGRPAVGLREKGLSALESLLFAKYQMYRNVYWHHAVRSATAMYKRLVGAALAAGALDPARLAPYTDEGLLLALEGGDVPAGVAAVRDDLRTAGLYKRALECPAAEFDERFGDWIADDHALTVAVEDALAGELGLAPGRAARRLPGQDADARARPAGAAARRDGGPRDRRRVGGRDQPADAQRPALPVGAVAAGVRGPRRGRAADRSRAGGCWPRCSGRRRSCGPRSRRGRRCSSGRRGRRPARRR
jgi:HD superfamily phosphohydrolase